MYLKKIEAQGFKSFANRAVLEFSPGIMGIVGPNGSGKSNVADAVRWVLGEQSAKQLRGSNMQDVIFAGTQNRKPMGYAFVALTIDNADHILAIDYEEVVISRQVFRSGESEYRINGNVCRLRDIYELFYDTGIGKEGYSIIGQGQIDKLLSSRPEERREMFDEAAGIVKYKKRKLITQKKLDAERQDLLRITDILGELEKQIGPLAGQSEKAKRYLALREELKSYEIGAFYLEAGELGGKLSEVSERLGIVSNDHDETQARAGKLRESYEAGEQETGRLEALLQEEAGRLSECRVNKENLEGRIGVLGEQINTELVNIEHFDGRMSAIAKELERKTQEKQQYIAEKTELNRQLDQMDDKLTGLEAKSESCDDDIRATEFEIEARNKKILDSMEQKAELSASARGFETRMEQLLLRRSELHQILLSARAGQEEQEQIVRSLREEESRVAEEIRGEKSRMDRLMQELSDSREASRSAGQRLNEKKDKYRMLSASAESLRNMAERYEGYGNSVRRVMEQKKRLPGLIGVVADLLAVDKKYETAIETALGGRIQNVVTDTEQTAQEAIRHLKENKLGRVTFLPISAVSGKENALPEAALREPGALGAAAGLIETAPRYKGIMSHLLGRVLVVDTMTHATAIARKYRYALNIVTLDGEYLSPGGAISGGAYKNASNLLSRKRELEELQERLSAVAAELSRLEKECKEAEETQEACRKQIDAARGKLEKLRLRDTTLNLQIKQAREEVGRWKESCHSHEEEAEKLRTAIAELKSGHKDIDRQAEQLEKDNAGLRREIERLTSRLEKEKEKKKEQAARLEALHVEFAGLNEKDRYLIENIRRITLEVAGLQEEQRTLEEGIRTGRSEAESRRQEIEALRARVGQTEDEIRKLELRVSENRKIKEQRQAEQQEIFKEREALSVLLASLDKELFRLQSQQERLQEQLDKQIEYLWTEYEMTPEQAANARNEAFTDLALIRREIAQRRTAIRSLGPVNVNAIEDYKEVSERYEFLKTQHEDLQKAEKSLLDIIAELESGMRRQFEEKFAQIKVEFDKVFRELFGGGKGTLELQEGEDILEAGIIINAQPPGKKLQNMMQLSGGEKALSAIALLFAIQNLKPSPFCLLDEIEAALDEPNVDRFASYLDKLKKTTQFLVITHRRGTMEMADRLYGVTMQEKGVSALVSVTLTEAGEL